MNTKNKRRNVLWIPIFVAIIVFMGIIYFFNFREDNNQPKLENDGYINYSPATEEEKEQADSAKKDIVDRQNGADKTETDSDNEKQTATVVITDAGQYENIIEVRSFIPDYYEDGICTIVFSKGSLEIVKETPAYRDATTTTCTNPLFNRSEFVEAGEWSVYVKYDSAGSSGKSDIMRVMVN